MRWSAVLEGEDVAAGVIVATKELTLPIVEVAPGAWRGDRGAVDEIVWSAFRVLPPAYPWCVRR